MAAPETVVIQIRDENTGHWLDYSRCTPQQAIYHLQAQTPGKFRGVDWITRAVTHPPIEGRGTLREQVYAEDDDALARGMELVNQCPECKGYTYSRADLMSAARGYLRVDDLPTHNCASPGYVPPTVHSVKREPDAVEVYRLGHYEQMQMSLALRLALQALDAPATGLAGLNEADAQVIREMSNIFSIPGTVTIMHEVES